MTRFAAIPRQCHGCGVPFEDRTRNHQQRYCTPLCAQRAWRQAHGVRLMDQERRCETCGTPYIPRRTQQRYCCAACDVAHAWRVHPHGHEVAHCGQWHALVTLPMTMPCCGAVVGGEEPTPCP